MKRMLSLLLCAGMLTLTACGPKEEPPIIDPAPERPVWEDAVHIELSDEGITVDGAPISHDEAAAVHDAADIIYYEAGRDFTYGEGTGADAHTAEEAAAHTVVTITRPGQYLLRGKLSTGQVAVDLGEEAKDNPEAVVTLILDQVDITCTVAPAVIFYNVYECGSDDPETATKDVDTSAAGANVHINGGTDNYITGSYVARIYKPDSIVLNEDKTAVEDAKKLHKYDAAFYSKMSMNVEGEGHLNIYAENEGMDSELHLTINGGYIDIYSGNDGINTNEDGVSVTTINGGRVEITVTGETGEGDGIDSNGWLVINEGACVLAYACANSADAGIDSDMGIHIADGSLVIATGHMLDRIEDAEQNYMVFQFEQSVPAGEKLELRNTEGKRVTDIEAPNDYSVLLFTTVGLGHGDYTLWSGETQLGHSGQRGGMTGGPGMAPGGMKPPEDFDPETMQPPAWNEGFKPEKGERPEPPEGFDPVSMPNMPADMPQHGGHPGGNRGPVAQTATEKLFTISYGKENHFYGVGELTSR